MSNIAVQIKTYPGIGNIFHPDILDGIVNYYKIIINRISPTAGCLRYFKAERFMVAGVESAAVKSIETDGNKFIVGKMADTVCAAGAIIFGMYFLIGKPTVQTHGDQCILINNTAHPYTAAVNILLAAAARICGWLQLLSSFRVDV